MVAVTVVIVSMSNVTNNGTGNNDVVAAVGMVTVVLTTIRITITRPMTTTTLANETSTTTITT